MDFDVISVSLKKAFDVFVANIVAYIVGFLICVVGSCFIVTIGPLFYGLYYMVLKGSRGETPDIKDIFCGFSSVSAFIRSWVGFLGFFLPLFVVYIIFFLLIMFSTALRLGFLSFLFMPVMFLIVFVLMIFLYFTLFIYVMTPSENIVFALKESFRISKSNLIMTILTIIIAGFCGILFVTMPIGLLFAASMLKEFEPSLKDQS
ncbi:MAG: hypothetical protein FWH46_04735 [Methanimicrococcus sp.]|nr:hypothetical protein [Methanimicrococcus sp.]